eukprot:scaffold20234_cov62-Phaeocystis_antarctica.AAC.4
MASSATESSARAAAASLCALSCCRATWVGSHSPRLALPKAMATRVSNGLQSLRKMTSSSSPLRMDNAMPRNALGAFPSSLTTPGDPAS